MKKLIMRTISAVMIAVMLITSMAFSTQAATYRSGANGASSAYANSVYYSNYQKVPITGDNVTDVLAIALSQLGYHEGSSVSDMAGNSTSSGNFTEYNYNMGTLNNSYGGSLYPWCASFVSWCLYQSHCTDHNSSSDWCRNHVGDSRYIWREIGCGSWTPNLKSAGYWQNSAKNGGNYTPKSGDLIFFRNNGHIGIVLYSENGMVYTVEGNTSDASGIEPEGGGVYFKNYPLTDVGIDGYGTMPYVSNSTVRKIDYSGKNPTAGYYIANATKYVYKDEACTQFAYYNDNVQCLLPRFTMIMVENVSADGTALKITYDGITGYVKNTLDTARMLQITSTEPLEGPENNLASQKDYQISGTNSPIIEEEWETNYSELLTNGVASNQFDHKNGSWFMLSSLHNAPNGVGTITIDFDNICDITKLRLHLSNQSGMLVKAPSSIKVYGSVDGVEYEEIGTMPIKTNDEIVYWSNLEVSNVKAGSVRFEFNLDGGYAYVNEVEVHGTATDEAYPRQPEIVEYSLSFDANGGTGEAVNNTLPDGSEFTLPENMFTAPEGMQFKCWSVNGIEFNANDKITIAGDTVISAVWEEIPVAAVKKLRGDVNENDKIDSRDYLLLKRGYFGTTRLSEIATRLADINANEKIDSRDYMLLKRVYFGTYTIPEDLKYVS